MLGEVEATHWFWDTEIIVRAQRHGFKVKEIPVEWTSGVGTKVNLAKDSWSMFWQVIISGGNSKPKAKSVGSPLRTNALATSDKPPIKIIPAQNTNHSLIIVILTGRSVLGNLFRARKQGFQSFPLFLEVASKPTL